MNSREPASQTKPAPDARGALLIPFTLHVSSFSPAVLPLAANIKLSRKATSLVDTFRAPRRTPRRNLARDKMPAEKNNKKPSCFVVHPLSVPTTARGNVPAGVPDCCLYTRIPRCCSQRVGQTTIPSVVEPKLHISSGFWRGKSSMQAMSCVAEFWPCPSENHRDEG